MESHADFTSDGEITHPLAKTEVGELTRLNLKQQRKPGVSGNRCEPRAKAFQQSPAGFESGSSTHETTLKSQERMIASPEFIG